jgi:transcriptional regulator with XRE-family HTH domain
MVARANAHVRYPARVQLVAAQNPCCRVAFLMDGVNARLRCAKPEIAALEGSSLGKQLYRRRRELGLIRREAASLIGCSWKSLLWWERDERTPTPPMYPAIIKFLGYEPWPVPETLPEKLKAERLRRGLGIKEAAKVIGVDECTLWWWESGRWKPRQAKPKAKITAFLTDRGS